jgi:hypothetical protein
LGQGTAAAAAAEKVTWDSYPYYLARFGVHKSRRYHAKMSGAFQSLSSAVLAINALAGAGAFIALLGGKSTLPAQILIGLVAAASAIDTVLGFSKRSKRHFDLCRRFTELAASIEEWEPTETNLKKAKAVGFILRQMSLRSCASSTLSLGTKNLELEATHLVISHQFRERRRSLAISLLLERSVLIDGATKERLAARTEQHRQAEPSADI